MITLALIVIFAVWLVVFIFLVLESFPHPGKTPNINKSKVWIARMLLLFGWLPVTILFTVMTLYTIEIRDYSYLEHYKEPRVQDRIWSALDNDGKITFIEFFVIDSLDKEIKEEARRAKNEELKKKYGPKR